MKAHYNGVGIFYKGSGESSDAVVLLHGWGASSAAMDGVYRTIEKLGRTVYSIDFPGFGESDYPPEDWGIYDYADCVQHFIDELGLVKPTLIGHSFGGRVATILGARGVAGKLVLTSAAGLKPRFSLSKKLAILRYKAQKRRGKAPENAGSPDYAGLPPCMKKVFVRVVNTHLDGLLKEIAVPTLLFWGKDDDQTPPYMAKRFHKHIRDSGLITVENAGHFAYAEKSGIFCAAVKSFITT